VRLNRITLGIVLFIVSVSLVSRSYGSSLLRSDDSDSIEVSLMTCYPGDKIWELYGHTSIRVRLKSGLDLAFNYGMFDFSTPNFVGRFLLGKTDYRLAVYPTSEFLSEYSFRGSPVVEQVLNLDKSEKENLFRALCINAREENCTYRYNFLYDNCTIEAINQIERAVIGRIDYPHPKQQESYRDIIHHYTKNSPWSEFGQDLLLGAKADVPISLREQMFAPLYLMNFAKDARIIEGNISRPLVIGTNEFQPQNKLSISKGFPLSPTVTFIIVMLCVAVACWAEIKKKTIFIALDTTLLSVQGIAGILIFVLFFFSSHPTVDSNYLIWVLNPLPLFVLFPKIRNIRKKRVDYISVVYSIILLLFLVASPFIPQKFSCAIICFVVSLLLQALTVCFIQYKCKWKRS